MAARVATVVATIRQEVERVALQSALRTIGGARLAHELCSRKKWPTNCPTLLPPLSPSGLKSSRKNSAAIRFRDETKFRSQIHCVKTQNQKIFRDRIPLHLENPMVGLDFQFVGPKDAKPAHNYVCTTCFAPFRLDLLTGPWTVDLTSRGTGLPLLVLHGGHRTFGSPVHGAGQRDVPHHVLRSTRRARLPRLHPKVTGLEVLDAHVGEVCKAQSVRMTLGVLPQDILIVVQKGLKACLLLHRVFVALAKILRMDKKSEKASQHPRCFKPGIQNLGLQTRTLLGEGKRAFASTSTGFCLSKTLEAQAAASFKYCSKARSTGVIAAVTATQHARKDTTRGREELIGGEKSDGVGRYLEPKDLRKLCVM